MLFLWLRYIFGGLDKFCMVLNRFLMGWIGFNGLDGFSMKVFGQFFDGGIWIGYR